VASTAAESKEVEANVAAKDEAVSSSSNDDVIEEQQQVQEQQSQPDDEAAQAATAAEPEAPAALAPAEVTAEALEEGEQGEVMEVVAPSPSATPAASAASAEPAAQVTTQASVPPPAAVPAKILRFQRRPAAPAVLLCPMPLPKDVASDAVKSQEVRFGLVRASTLFVTLVISAVIPSLRQATALRLVSLSALLAYTQDDVNERIFEVSLAAEMLRSALAVGFATLVADFVFAEHETLHAVADPRVVRAVRRLRAMSEASAAKARSEVSARLKAIAEQESQLLNKAAPAAAAAAAPASAGGDAAAATVETAGATSTTTSAEAEEVEVTWSVTGQSAAGAATEGEGTAAAGGAGADAGAAEQGAQESMAVENDDATTASAKQQDGGAPQEQEQGQGQEQEQGHGGDGDPAAPAGHEPQAADCDGKDDAAHALALSAAPEMSDDEALEWRAHFHAACRWFDTEQDRFLRADHLLLVLQSSPREVSRSDASAAVWRVCREHERLRYESFI
jgi:hypothetical protein